MARRLILLWIACMAMVALLPPSSVNASSGAVSSAQHHHAGCCPDYSDRTGLCSDHGCLGCSIEPADDVVLQPVVLTTAQPPIATRPIAPADHRPSFDPPPPRVPPSTTS